MFANWVLLYPFKENEDFQREQIPLISKKWLTVQEVTPILSIDYSSRHEQHSYDDKKWSTNFLVLAC